VREISELLGYAKESKKTKTKEKQKQKEKNINLNGEVKTNKEARRCSWSSEICCLS